MIKIKYISLAFFVYVVATLFFACKKTHDMPLVQTSAVGGTLTIAQLRALYNGQNIKFTQDVSLFATVTMSDNYKTLFVRDNTGSITVKQITAHGIYEGDSLRINLKGAYLDLSGNLSSLQIDSLDVSSSPTNKVVKLAVGKEHSPVTVTIAQLTASASNTTYATPTGNVILPQSIYDGELVQINNIQFAYTDSANFIPLNNPPLFVNHNLYDCGGVNFINMSLYSNTSDFLYQKVPHTKSGSIVAAVTFYNGALQLTPRSFSDLKFNQPRCGIDTLTQSFSSCASSSNFATALPGWYDVAEVGSLIWTGNASYPNGYPSASNFGAPARNVMWLISPPIQNSPTKNVNFQVEYFFPTANKPRQLSVWVSTDFNGQNIVMNSANPNVAHWTEITPAFVNLMNLNTYPASFFFNANSTPVFLNQISAFQQAVPASSTFFIGFKYIGNMVTTDSTQTFAIDNFSLKD